MPSDSLPFAMPTASQTSMSTIRIGCVPEHFSTPLLQCTFNRLAVPVQVILCPGGTGEMVRMLEQKELDMAIALTEGLVMRLTQYVIDGKKEQFKIVGQYTETPLTWSIATSPKRGAETVSSVSYEASLVNEENHALWKSLLGSKVGISRLGSGSHIIPHVMADELDCKNVAPFEFVVLKDIQGLRLGIENKAIDCFLWERFTTKPYYDSGELFHLSNITPPWPSFMIAASSDMLNKSEWVDAILQDLSLSAQNFVHDWTSQSAFVQERFHLNAQDANKWFQTVQYATDMRRISSSALQDCLRILSQAHLFDKDELDKKHVQIHQFVDDTVSTLY